jgi:hypothetical protein
MLLARFTRYARSQKEVVAHGVARAAWGRGIERRPSAFASNLPSVVLSAAPAKPAEAVAGSAGTSPGTCASACPS